MRKFCLIVLALLIGTVTVGAQPSQTLTVFAAASLTDAFTELGDAFAAANPGVEVTFNFGGSSALAAQLAEGAPADVFASANEAQMQKAIDAGRIAEPALIFARNRLVVALQAELQDSVTTLIDLAEPGLLLVLAAPGVPVRDYADAMFAAMAESPDYGIAYRDAVLANLVSEEDNVRQVLAKIALGEADAGIVYQSDITPDLSDDVIALDVPDAFNTIATYPIARTNDSAVPDVADAFIAYVLSEVGQDVLLKWNFVGRCAVLDATAPEATPEAEATPTAEATPEPIQDAECP